MSDPFSASADPGMYVPRDSAEAALREIVGQLEAGRPQVRLSGAPGMGKTLALKLLPARLGAGWRLAHLPHPSLDAAGLWHWVATALGLARPTEAAVRRHAAEAAQLGLGVVLAVDDANRMPQATRSALERACAEQPGLHCVLAEGGSERGPRDAIPVASPLTLPELQAYVTTRLDRAGAAGALRARFDAAELERLHRTSAGVPQRVHQQIGRSLLREEWARLQRARRARADGAPTPAASVRPKRLAPRAVEGAGGAAAATPVVPEARAEPPPPRAAPQAPPSSPAPLETAPGLAAAQEARAAEGCRARYTRQPRQLADWTACLAVAAAKDARRRPLRALAAVSAVACAAASLGLALGSFEDEPLYRTAAASPPVAAPPPGVSQGVPVAASPLAVRPPQTSPAPGPAREDAPAPTDVALGRINVNALPWATIRVDGESIGETPLGEHAVPRGAHVIEAHFPDGRVERREIELGPDDDVFLVFR